MSEYDDEYDNVFRLFWNQQTYLCEPAYVGYSFVATRKSLKSVANEPDEFKL